MKIIFMGTPEFACPTLEKLIADSEIEIIAVYTREPQVAGRGHRITNSPIHDLALKHNLKIITPRTLKTLKNQQEFINLNADAAVVVAYGLILPEEILQGTKYGCINLHPSLLPRWRGAAPIQHTILSGDNETAITIIKMDRGIDSGEMLCQEKMTLSGTETTLDLAKITSKKGADIIVRTLKELPKNTLKAVKQDDNLATYAKKIEKLDYEIDWTNSAAEIERKIRALNGSLGAYFIHNGEKIKIFSATIVDEDSNQYEAGEIIDDKLSIQCGKGIISPEILQRQGKRAMERKEFLLGFRI